MGMALLTLKKSISGLLKQFQRWQRPKALLEEKTLYIFSALQTRSDSFAIISNHIMNVVAFKNQEELSYEKLH
ncbi:hypothetical protein Avbf_07323 [Armadillidium vulgare]|nr:hypothetical protein Avbf_07323 [Armadillidium vulgare]